MVSDLSPVLQMKDVDPDLTCVNPILIQAIRYDLITTFARQIATVAKDKQDIEDLLNSPSQSHEQWAAW